MDCARGGATHGAAPGVRPGRNPAGGWGATSRPARDGPDRFIEREGTSRRHPPPRTRTRCPPGRIAVPAWRGALGRDGGRADGQSGHAATAARSAPGDDGRRSACRAFGECRRSGGSSSAADTRRLVGTCGSSRAAAGPGLDGTCRRHRCRDGNCRFDCTGCSGGSRNSAIRRYRINGGVRVRRPRAARPDDAGSRARRDGAGDHSAGHRTSPGGTGTDCPRAGSSGATACRCSGRIRSPRDGG